MPRPSSPFGGDAAYLVPTGQDLYDTPLASLPPVTRAVRAAWAAATSPVASAAVVAAMFVAINALETRLAALEAH